MNLVVTDTGPLLHLHQIGAGDLISRLGENHLTLYVWAELHLSTRDLVTAITR